MAAHTGISLLDFPENDENNPWAETESHPSPVPLSGCAVELHRPPPIASTTWWYHLLFGGLVQLSLKCRSWLIWKQVLLSKTLSQEIQLLYNQSGPYLLLLKRESVFVSLWWNIILMLPPRNTGLHCCLLLCLAPCVNMQTLGWHSVMIAACRHHAYPRCCYATAGNLSPSPLS